MTKVEQAPFSYPVKVGHISANPVEVHLEADERERSEIARVWNVLEVKSFEAGLQIQRWKKDGVRVKGRVTSAIVQACVVTLDPVESLIDETFEALFVPQGSKLAQMPRPEGEMLLDPDGPDAPEIFTGDTVDAGEIAAEHAALAIDPYPRKEGIDFKGHIESTEEDDRKPSPFAVLKDWKKD
ncbi:DUF177 domain-containing protein [Sinorhizobium sp. BG8]|uniref:YceD family protein n=1 Tax=Sinorhizobium sp. BG8 TaxID=2613773 RepID=UPI00193E0DF7|nr:DUF177 domain-containing protein [Sinorhizobium sp. BG8]QRM54954.1 DUF177 domain-containing protein [Sinorhizobium sp. BG8]